jgi:mannose-6-phosphate isomerase-like protein (cupin superfamily)
MKNIFLLLLHTIAMSTFAQLKPVGSGVFHWAELPVKKDDLREGRKIAEGTTPEFSYFEIHATTQQKGAVPRPPHTQKDIEEVIIIKEGTMKCSIGNKTAVLGPGSVLLIPPLEAQTFENIGNAPLTYYVFMFRSKDSMSMERSNRAGGALLLNADSLELKTTARGTSKKYFDRPTAMCGNYEMHITQLSQKGPSHTPHQHVDTEIILIIDGETEMMIDGKTYTAGPGDMYIAESGKMHGISNASDKPCSYFAFKWRP